MNYLVEEWGGKYQCQEISAKKGLNVEELLEKVLLGRNPRVKGQPETESDRFNHRVLAG